MMLKDVGYRKAEKASDDQEKDVLTGVGVAVDHVLPLAERDARDNGANESAPARLA